MNEYLRKEVGFLHGYNHITYKRLADEIGVKEDTISKWTRHKFNFSRKNQLALYHAIDKIKKEG